MKGQDKNILAPLPLYVMTSLERVRATIRFEEVDRPPVIPEIAAVTAVMKGISVKEYVLDGEVIARCQIDALRSFGHDAVFAFADLCVEAEALGCRLFYPDNNYPYVALPLLKDCDDLSLLRIPDPQSDGRMPQIIDAVKIMKKELGGKTPVVAHALGPITIASRIMDIEKMLYMIVDRPDGFRRILDFTTEAAVRFIRSLLEAGADSIIMFNPSASPSVLPKRIFDEFELPNLKKIFGMIKGINRDIITWYSVAGPIQQIIPSIGAAPVDILTIDYLVPLQVAFEQSGNMCFSGNIKPLDFVEGAPDKIRKESLSLVKSSLGRGGFILGSGCEIPPDAKKENIKAMVESVYDAGEIEDLEFFNPKSEVRNQKFSVTLYPHRKRIFVKDGENLLDAIHASGARITSFCNKSGSCGKCVVRVKKGMTAEPDQIERLQLSQEELNGNYRLACKLKVEEDIEIFVPFKSRILNDSIDIKKRFLKESLEKELKEYGFYPAIYMKNIKIPFKPAADGKLVVSEANLSDYQILSGAMDSKYKLSPAIVSQFSDRLRDNSGEINVVADNLSERVIDISKRREIYGMAVDLGTTTITGYLHDMEKGRLVSANSILNPQIVRGADLMTRAEYCLKENKRLVELQNKLIEGINRLVAYFHRDAGILPDSIYKLTLVGNTLIHHIFLGINPKHLVRSPFTPSISYLYSSPLGEFKTDLKLNVNPSARIEFLPIIGGFIGADTVAGILASGIHRKKEVSLFIDLGTNGEIVLGNSDWMTACSVAAGPAFEGSRLTSGRMFGRGIVYKVDMDGDFHISYETVDDFKPVGLCGSAVIDTIASFLKRGIINERGYFNRELKSHKLLDDKFILIPKQHTANFEPIVITRRDIEEVQKAKAAVHTGILLLLKKKGLKKDDLDRIYISGSFGAAIDKENAIRIGIVPEVEKDKIEFVGDAAGTGARMALLSLKAREEAELIADKVEHVQIVNDEDFNDIFIDSMLFKG